MKLSLLYFVIAASALVSTSNAAVTISLTGNPTTGPAFFVAAGSSVVVPDGSLVRLGTFATAPSANATFDVLAAGFQEFARTTMGNSTNVNTGHIVRQNIEGSATTDSPQPDSFFVGKAVYIWVYSSVAAAPAVPQGIFATTQSYADQATALSTSLTGYANAFGTFDPGTPASVAVGGTGLVTRFNLAAPVPEPTSMLTLALAMGAFAVRRRR